MNESILINPAVPFKSNRLLHLVMIFYVAFWILMAIEPYSRFDWLLENLLIFAALVLVAATYRRFVFSNLSYILTALFLALHTLGAHYSYSGTPFDDWLHWLFHTERNGYDRVVHFCYGLLLAYPVKELIVRKLRLNGFSGFWLSPVIILASGAFYELIEMWVAFIVAPEIGTLFLGTQGDVWDTQHDMELALYGSVIAMFFAAAANKRTDRAEPKMTDHMTNSTYIQ
jgi:putative membrane protein